MKMSKKLMSLALICLVLVAGLAFANRTETINIVYDNIQLMIKGKSVVPKDANGNIVQPFIYNGTTYLPVRAVGEALNLDVSWDSETKTVSLAEPKPATAQYLIDLMMPDDYRYFEVPANSYTVNGNTYDEGFRLGYGYDSGNATFKLNNQYSNFSGAFCHDYNDDREIKITVKGDGKLLYTTTLAQEQQITFDIDITGVKELKLESTDQIFVANPRVK